MRLPTVTLTIMLCARQAGRCPRELAIVARFERTLAEAWPHGPFASRHRMVGQITPGSVRTVLPEVSAARVAAIMYDQGVDAVPVVDRRGNVVGVVAAQDLLGVLARLTG